MRTRRYLFEQLETRALLAANPIGPEFRVNTHVANTQSRPSIAMDADGDYVVAWESDLQDGSNFGVYAQRYNAAGVAQGSEFRVNTFTTSFQSAPSVAMDADGDFVVAWSSLEQDGETQFGIYAQRYNAAGATQGSEFRVNTFTTNSQGFPSVAMDADGDFVVTWQSYAQDGSGNGIYAQRYNAAGATQGSEFRVNTFTTDVQFIPSVAMDADGDFVVTWASLNQDGSGSGIYAKRYNAAGATQGGEFRVNTFTTSSQTFPSVAMDADGDFVVTWQGRDQDGSNYGIYAQRYTAAGVPQGTEFRVNTFTTNVQRDPSVAIDADGDFVVTWRSKEQDGSSYGIYAQGYTAAGVPQGSEFHVNTFTTNNQSNPSVAMDADGDFVVTWHSYTQDGSGYGIYAQRYQLDAPSNGVLTVDGTSLGDTIALQIVTPGGVPQLSVVRNGVEFLFDPSQVLAIIINGQSGDDTLSIGSTVTIGATINGGDDNDRLIGGGGNDVLLGGAGNDTYAFDTDAALGLDTVSDIGGGIDTLDFSETTTLGVAANLGLVGSQTVNANLNLNLSSAVTIENLIGGALADTLIGNARPNVFTGGGGNDFMTGGAGNDRYLFDTDLVLGSDTINESGGGVDTLDFGATSTKPVAINLSGAAAQTVTASNLSLTLSAGNAIENAIGGSFRNVFTGNSLNNRFDGGTGADTYKFDTDTSQGSDLIVETGSGVDTVDFSTTESLAVAVNLATTSPQVVNANLTLRLSSGALLENVIGGNQGDTLTGNTLNNVLTGRGGNDTLNGGTGNDTYLFDTDLALGADTIIDTAGVDTVDFGLTTTRGVTVNLASTSAQAVNAGLTLTLASPTSIDNVIGGALGDTLTGNTLANVLTGGLGNDVMTGGAGNDTLVGAAGNDTYLFDTDLAQGSDTINESGGGIDTLNFSATTTKSVAVNLSNAAAQVVTAGRLTLTLSAGNTIEAVIGGALADSLTGNTLNNILTGGGGNDILTGSSGNDSYLFDTDLSLGTDTINDSGGIDTLNFSPTTTQAITVDLSLSTVQIINANLSLNLQSATTIENAIGGSLNDSLTGNTIANTLTGLAGNDTFAGGAGNDRYVFDTDTALGTDTIIEVAAGGGVDTLDFSTTTTVGVEVSLSLASAQVVNTNLTLILSAGNSIENASGGSLDDILIGNTLANSLLGNAGDDVLSGLAGNDTLIGGLGKNLLFGGFGADMLTGGTSEDLMLGAKYLLENDIDALGSLRAEWVSSSNFNSRVGHILGTIAGGLNSGFTLNQGTVKEDSSPDTLTGGTGRDWYLRNSLGAVVPLRDTLVDTDVDSVFEEISTWI